jgi:hypothetical protein
MACRSRVLLRFGGEIILFVSNHLVVPSQWLQLIAGRSCQIRTLMILSQFGYGRKERYESVVFPYCRAMTCKDACQADRCLRRISRKASWSPRQARLYPRQYLLQILASSLFSPSWRQRARVWPQGANSMASWIPQKLRYSDTSVGIFPCVMRFLC